MVYLFPVFDNLIIVSLPVFIVENKAIGNVDFEFKNDKAHYKGKADTVEYFPLKSLYILTGKSNVDDLLNKRSVKGDKITVDMLTGDSIVEGTRKKPVKFIFEMKDEK